MGSTCILTDGTAQFTRLAFPGRNLVTVMPLEISYNGQVYGEGKDLKPGSLPASVQKENAPRLVIPTPEDFRKVIANLGQEYNEVVAIVTSSNLCPIFENAVEAAQGMRGRVSVQVIDSQSISVGLGFLVQVAAEAAAKGARATEIDRLLRGIIPHIYAVFCIPGLTYLYHSGFLGQAQAMVGEMLGLLPIYSLEEGHLTPLEKARNYRQLMDFLQEFLDEFDNLRQIALIQSAPAQVHDAHVLREHANTNFPRTPFSEHAINLPLAILFGPRTVGLFVMESEED